MSGQHGKVYGIIPARLESSRLPRKLLLPAADGKPLIQHTWEAVRAATVLSDVIVATDSLEIQEAVVGFGGRCELTGEHPSGTDRVAEVVRRLCPDAEFIVNIQGDEPEIRVEHIDAVVRAIVDNRDSEVARDSQIAMATLASRITCLETLQDPSCVKVVCDESGRALYFSRLPIPFCRDRSPQELLDQDSPWLLHVGLYAYRTDFLLEFTRRPPSRLEQLEKLEQLRALEMGARIQVSVVESHAPGIDTPDDYARFLARRRTAA